MILVAKTAACQNIFLANVAVAILVSALPWSAHSQSPTTTAATTTDQFILEETPTQERWFSVEQLSGERLDMGDFVISPGKVELELEPGQTVIQEISVANRVSDDRTFFIEIEDMVGTSDGSQSIVLLGDERGPYSVQDIVSVPAESFEIGLGELARIPVTISVPADAEPGGYYGSVLVSTVRSNGDASVPGAPRSPIVARVGTLFFITVPGEVTTEGSLKDFTLLGDDWWHEAGPVDFGLVFENTGSRHLTPYGEIRITNMLGEEVGFVALDPWFVMPEAVRLREVSWDRELLLGRYTATAQINRGYDDVIDELTVSFWVLPWKIVLGTFFGLFTIIFLIRAFFRTFEFKRKS